MQPSYNPGRSAYADGKPCIFQPSRKENQMLLTFTQDAKDYKLRRNILVDHMCRSTNRWRNILDFVQMGKSPITMAWLRNDHVDGISAWDLSVMFESFVIDFLPRSMYTRRTQISNGEFGNGFELWRRLFLEFQGGSDAVEFGGVRRLLDFPKCESLTKLSEHIDDWLDVLSNYGTELASCPTLLRNMLLGILPRSLEQEILDKAHRPDFKTYQGIIAFCRQKVTQARTKELPELARKPPSHVKSLKGKDFDYDGARGGDPDGPAVAQNLSWQQMKDELIAALRSSGDVEGVPHPLDALVAAVRPAPKRKIQPGMQAGYHQEVLLQGLLALQGRRPQSRSLPPLSRTSPKGQSWSHRAQTHEAPDELQRSL